MIDADAVKLPVRVEPAESDRYAIAVTSVFVAEPETPKVPDAIVMVEEATAVLPTAPRLMMSLPSAPLTLWAVSVVPRPRMVIVSFALVAVSDAAAVGMP